MSKPLCTVLIPFDAPGQARFATLEKLGEAQGFRTMRVAQYYSSGMILEEIVRSIRDAQLIIADLTECNANVCYELGIAHALGKRVFLVADTPDECHIDFGVLRVNRFEDTQAGHDRLNHELRTFADTPGTLSPINFFSGGLAVAGQPLMVRRLSGFALDFVIASVAALLFQMLVAGLVPELSKTREEFAFPAGMMLYFVLTSILLGTTPGQRMMGLKVTRLDRSEPSLLEKFLRPIAALLSLFSAGIGFFWAARPPRHQAIHDIITRTLVLRRGTFESSADKGTIARN